MAVKVIEADQPMEIDQIVLVLYGQPGGGKSTLGYSARNPLLLDFDGGASGANIRKGGTVQIRSWDDIEDLNAEVLSGYDTLVVDTVGALLRHRIHKMIADDPKMGSGASRQQPSQRGWGKLGGDFADWLEEMKLYGLDIILLSHSKEIQVDDGMVQRLQMPGQMAENMVYQSATQIGHIRPYANTMGRIQFSPTDATYGKDRGGIGYVDVPNIDRFENYDFIGDLIATVKSNINERQKGFDFPEEGEDGKPVITDSLLERLSQTGKTMKGRKGNEQLAFAAQLERLGVVWDKDRQAVVRVGSDTSEVDAEAMQLDGQEG